MDSNLSVDDEMAPRIDDPLMSPGGGGNLAGGRRGNRVVLPPLQRGAGAGAAAAFVSDASSRARPTVVVPPPSGRRATGGGEIHEQRADDAPRYKVCVCECVGMGPFASALYIQLAPFAMPIESGVATTSKTKEP